MPLTMTFTIPCGSHNKLRIKTISVVATVCLFKYNLQKGLALPHTQHWCSALKCMFLTKHSYKRFTIWGERKWSPNRFRLITRKYCNKEIISQTQTSLLFGLVNCLVLFPSLLGKTSFHCVTDYGNFLSGRWWAVTFCNAIQMSPSSGLQHTATSRSLFQPCQKQRGVTFLLFDSIKCSYFSYWFS